VDTVADKSMYMKSSLYRVAALALAASFSAFFAVSSEAQVTLEKIKADAFAGAGIYHIYRAGNMTDTAAPEGYEPFYISHIGRHGSRYHSSDKSFDALAVMFMKADSLGILTEKGKALYSDLYRIDSVSVGKAGKLSARGKNEHKEIAGRMFHRFPSVFKSGSRRYVDAVSSTVQRCQESMFSCTGELKKLNKKLRVNVHSGDSYMSYLLRKPSWFKEVVRTSAPEIDSLSRTWIDVSDFMNSIFSDRKTADSIVGREDMFARELYTWGSIAPDIDLNDIFVSSYFTPEELFSLTRLNSCRIYSEMVNAAESEGRRIAMADDLLEDFIVKANAAVSAKSNVAADLRFAHDVSVMPLAGLMGIEGCSESWPLEEVWEHWMASDFTPMACNLQMVFYRRPGSKDILVKFLLNEQERLLNGVDPVSGPYYRWKDVRRHLSGRLAYARKVDAGNR